MCLINFLWYNHPLSTIDCFVHEPEAGISSVTPKQKEREQALLYSSFLNCTDFGKSQLSILQDIYLSLWSSCWTALRRVVQWLELTCPRVPSAFPSGRLAWTLSVPSCMLPKWWSVFTDYFHICMHTVSIWTELLYGWIYFTWLLQKQTAYKQATKGPMVLSPFWGITQWE